MLPHAMTISIARIALLLLVGVSGLLGRIARAQTDEPAAELFQYVRPAGSEFIPETEFKLETMTTGLVITSVTQQGQQKLTLVSRYRGEQELLQASVAVLRAGQPEESAEVRVTGERGRILRGDLPVVTLPCPPGVIVTSAPDWTDAFLAVRRYRHMGPATQTFAGLWIHPQREPLELSIQLTKIGQVSVRRGEEPQQLDRFRLILRAGTTYTVWGNSQQQLVRLLPAKASSGGIMLQGWEDATRELRD